MSDFSDPSVSPERETTRQFLERMEQKFDEFRVGTSYEGRAFLPGNVVGFIQAVDVDGNAQEVALYREFKESLDWENDRSRLELTLREQRALREDPARSCGGISLGADLKPQGSGPRTEALSNMTPERIAIARAVAGNEHYDTLYLDNVEDETNRSRSVRQLNYARERREAFPVNGPRNGGWYVGPKFEERDRATERVQECIDNGWELGHQERAAHADRERRRAEARAERNRIALDLLRSRAAG